NPAQDNSTQDNNTQENPAQENSTQENPTQVTPPVVPKVLPQPEIVINPITPDNIINNVESKEQIKISGTVTNAKTNDSLTLKIGNTTLTATVQADGKFSTTTRGSILESSREIVATITTRDNEGNQATGTKTHQYDVITNIVKPTITLNNITYDNVLDIAEKEYEEITLSGTVKDAKINDIVTLQIGNTTITTHVKDNGTFSVETGGAILATSQNIIASVTTQDSVGNQATATTTHEYRHSDFVPVRKRPSIQFIKVTEDNILNANEAKQDKVEIKVSVAFTEPDDVVTLKIGDISLATTKEGDYYKATTSGDIVANGKGTLLISIVGYDHTGYKFTQETPYEYYVMTTIPQPIIQFNDITDQNSINLAESKLSEVVVSGTATNAADGDKLTLQIGNKTFTTEVKNERFSITTSGEILAKNNKITASLTTTDIAGNQATANATHDYKVLPVYSTKVTYPDRVLSYESNESFDFSSLKYTLADPQSYVLQNSEAKAKVIAALEKYVQENPDLAAQNIKASYKADSDGDGIIDIYDKNPQMWNVSERDLRFFATAAHSSENVNKNIFERYNEDRINDFNAQRLNNGADIRDINKHWDLLKSVQAGDGLEYRIYGNGKQADKSYQNVVIGFKGTNNATDWIGNANIAIGQKHPQLNHLQQAMEYVAEYKPHNLYVTGASLGGYLAQYFATYTIQNSPELATAFQRTSLFNTALLKTNSNSPEDLKQARATTDNYVKQTIMDDSDTSNTVKLHTTNSYVIKGEWLSDGYPFLFNGLGTYENTTFFNGTGSSTDKHNMSQFFNNNAKLEEIFTRGYLMDKHYLNKDTDNDGLTNQQEAKLGTKRNEIDSDGDSFSDKLEAQLKSDPLNTNTIPDFLDKINIQEVFASIAVTIESQSSQGGSKTKETALTASLEGSNIVYTLDPAVAAEHTSEFVI
ncbi:Ig-like domain-containing protein, partial [Mannheimia indoligenes]|uniref:Ig-like domain-containing protein n=1 Tax=Mannheimia indoligenes TaxID=3103145 RepID=UPI002FE62839